MKPASRKCADERQTDTLTIEGQLLMADFKEGEAQCRVHPRAGDAVLCQFTDEQKDKVRANMLNFVRIVGKAKKNPAGKVTRIQIRDIKRLSGDGGDVSPLPGAEDFWKSPSLEELARLQNVKPIKDFRELLGVWPGKDNDGFEEAIDKLRHPDREGG